MMGKKEERPWGFGLFAGKNGTKAILAFFIVLFISIMTHVVGAIHGEIKDRRERPVLALKSFLRDVREFIRTEKKIPGDLRELEVKIWDKTRPGTPSRLHGTNIYVANNYEYVFFSGNVENKQPQVTIWAIPLGKYRDDYETVLIVIRNEGETVWRGPALNDAQRSFVLAKGFNPSLPEMAQINMKLDAKPKEEKKKGFGFF